MQIRSNDFLIGEFGDNNWFIGVIYYSDGEESRGEFKGNVPQGTITVITKSGQRFDKIWENGEWKLSKLIED